MSDRAKTVRRPGRPGRLSRDAVVAAAEVVVGREGIEALTMRRVAEELHSSPMALYRHVRDKDELLVLLLDRLASRLPRPTLPEEPRQRLLALWRILHEGLDDHPWVVGVLVKGDLMAPSVLWLMEEILAAFVAAGLSPTAAAAAYRTVWQYTVGELTIRHATARRTAELGRQRLQLAILAGVDPQRMPMLASLAEFWPRSWDYDDGLSAILDGLLATV